MLQIIVLGGTDKGWLMVDDQDKYEWMNVSSRTGSPG